MKAVLERLNGNNDNKSICTLKETCSNHLISFAAEESRLSGKVIDFKEYEESFGGLI